MAAKHAIRLYSQYSEEKIKYVPDNAALVAIVAAHVVVTTVSDSKDVWWELAQFTPVIQVHLLRRVDGQHLIGIHGHQDRANIGLNSTHRENYT